MLENLERFEQDKSNEKKSPDPYEKPESETDSEKKQKTSDESEKPKNDIPEENAASESENISSEE